jgi:hypothetical protein
MGITAGIPVAVMASGAVAVVIIHAVPVMAFTIVRTSAVIETTAIMAAALALSGTTVITAMVITVTISIGGHGQRSREKGGRETQSSFIQHLIILIICSV